jgi:S-adenosylmethionine:tRNA-ribosyltransferase-isomerase (queuine synthetase)
VRLLVVDPLTGRFGDYSFAELPALLEPHDVLVVNDAATLPASLRVDDTLELRLLAAEESGTFRAVALGAGDFRIPTEERGPPRVLRSGERLRLGPELDARLPLAERYEISPAAAAAIAAARHAGGRVIAAGASVVRALEAQADAGGFVAPGRGETELRLTHAYEPRVVDGLLTGLHEPGTSDFELLEALAPSALLGRAIEHAARTGYLQHEFGDSCLVLAGALLERLPA